MEDGKPIFGPTKKASRRVVPLSQSVIDVLAAHLATYPTAPEGLLFTNDNGEPWQRNRVNEVWVQARTKAAVRSRVA